MVLAARVDNATSLFVCSVRQEGGDWAALPTTTSFTMMAVAWTECCVLRADTSGWSWGAGCTPCMPVGGGEKREWLCRSDPGKAGQPWRHHAAGGNAAPRRGQLGLREAPCVRASVAGLNTAMPCQSLKLHSNDLWTHEEPNTLNISHEAWRRSTLECLEWGHAGIKLELHTSTRSLSTPPPSPCFVTSAYESSDGP